jgi:LacI family transcriptional regulator
VTLKDIAKLANTSVSTVSRSLNDSHLVLDETKQRIKQIAEEQGFQFNANARGLVTNTTGTVGVILPENFDRFDVQLYHAALHNDFRRSLERADKEMIVAFLNNRFNGMKNVEKLVTRKKVDGLILVLPAIDRETQRYLKRSRIPFVMTQYPPADAEPGYDVVYSDNWTGGKLVAEHVLERGFSRVACISAGEEIQSRQRMAGLTETLSLNGVDVDPDLVLCGDYQSSTAAELVRDHIDRLRDVEVIFALNDLMAFGVMQALHAEGVRVPHDIAVIGYDDTPLASLTIPKLTSVHQSREEIAFLACELLLDLIEQVSHGPAQENTPRAVAIQPRLVVRESSDRS